VTKILPATKAASNTDERAILSPAAQKIATENNLTLKSGTGKDGRITKNDVLSAISKSAPSVPTTKEPREERVRMTKLRQKIAQRLKDSQNTAAILTTFNEVDMTNIIALRNEYKDIFLKKYDAKLGFMSFFTKAAISALKELPAVNAEIQGEEIVYKNHYDISVAVGTPQGLVVPVVRNADKMSFAEIETEIVTLGKKARDGKLTMEDMTGGTFTISNGGVYGSLLSTPIINPPQSGILGLHKIQERVMVINGEMKIRQMMYIALSYDHRIIDGKEAVTFLIKIKEAIEDPRRLLLDI
jgi:2-oxoglutarate dehydrogenase E2 component (dihydrolipoamide succinyltransferase)